MPWPFWTVRFTAKKTETTHNVSIVSFKRVVLTVIFVMCGFSLCPLNPEESHTKKFKMSYCFFHHTFRTHHAALDLYLLPHLQLRAHPPSVALPLLRHLDATMFLSVPLLACAVLAPDMAMIIITHFVIEFACDVNS